MFLNILFAVCILAVIGGIGNVAKFVCGVGNAEEREWGIAFLIAFGLTTLSVLIAYLWV